MRRWIGCCRQVARWPSTWARAPDCSPARSWPAAQVIAVEPDARMRKVLAARSPGVRVVEGRGESIPLPDAAADAVFVSSAWHWMDHERAVPEIGRVLRDGGRLGLIWTSRDREVDWLRNLDRLPGSDASEAESADRLRRHLDFALPEPQIFHNIARETFEFVRTMTSRTPSRWWAPTAESSSRLRMIARRGWLKHAPPWRRVSLQPT